MNQDQPQSDVEQAEQTQPASESESLEGQLQALRQELAVLKSDALRDRADLENQRRRLARDMDQARKFANEKLLGELLPVLDSLDAGLTAAGEQSGPLRDGLELTYKQLLKVAQDNGLERIDPINQAFDPAHHQAISQLSSQTVEPDHVIQVFQKGYLLNERLLRPALVVVAKKD